MGKSLTKMQLEEDNLVAGLEVGMKFTLSEKNKLGRKTIEQEDGIEVTGVKNFKFKEDDVIVIDELGERTVSFHVQRDGEDQTKKEKVIGFQFNKLIFIQRFAPITDIKDVVNKTSEAVVDTLAAE